MLDYVPSFTQLVSELNKLPGIGPKTAQRLAYYILNSPEQYSQGLSKAMHEMHLKVRKCEQCFALTENDNLCHFCEDTKRNDSLLCIVEQPSDISRLEFSGAFRGRYHVLHGVISPLDGVGPEDLTTQALIHRIDLSLKTEETAIKEVILALDADLEGDTTVLYLAKILKERGIKISRIAHGIPIGGDIDYVDHRTLGRALENRVDV